MIPLTDALDAAVGRAAEVNALNRFGAFLQTPSGACSLTGEHVFV
jgi:hypothetical protein